MAVVISQKFDGLGKDGRSAKLGIMGGTFDPIHVGHLACAEQAREACGLNGVLFIPTGSPVFKRGQNIAESQHRLAMCRLAVGENPSFDVSSIEVDRLGETYSVDTLRALRSHFPANVELCFIMGADSLATLPRWKDSDVIAGLTRIVAVTRPGYPLDETLRAKLADKGFQVDYPAFTEVQISSSALRRLAHNGHSIRYYTTDAVAAYVAAHNVYADYDPDEPHHAMVATSWEEAKAMPLGEPTGPASNGQHSDEPEDPFSKKFLKARKKELEKRVSGKRLKHIEGVADTAYKLAKIYGVDPQRAYLAGLLHDWDKGLNNEAARARVVELGMEDEVSPWVLEHMPEVLHGPTAAKALKRDFPAIPDDVLQAIDRHTTAAYDMTDLDKIVYIADALEPSRQFGLIDELRESVGKVSLDELFFRVYEYWVSLLFERRRMLHPDTVNIWNTYIEQRNAERERKQRDR